MDGSMARIPWVLICIGLVVFLAIMTVRTKPDWGQVTAASRVDRIGGITGAVFVVGSLLVVPKTGIVLFLPSVILDQMIGAITADGLGLWVLEEMSSAR